MKKSSYVAMVLGTVSGVLFALGMCMALLPEWNAFTEGVILGAVGAVLGVITWFVWRKMEKKPPLRLTGKSVAVTLLAVTGALLLGVGMCCCMVWEQMVLGIVIGLVGIVALLTLVPLMKGFR